MKKTFVLLFAMILSAFLLSMSLAWAEKSADSGKSQSNKAYTPPQGDQERKAILDTLRKRWPPGTDTIFVVKYLKVKNGWAWIHVAPQSRDGRSHFEDESWLLQKINDQWKEVTARGTGMECIEDPDCSDDKRFYKKLKSEYPDMPVDILPYEGEGKPAAYVIL